jgi:predicted lipoprotein with Yx(FWY)xxD motif
MKARRFLLVAVVLGALAIVSSAFAMTAHSSKASTTVTTKKTKLGTILVTSSGRTLYLDKADKKGHPACKGACLTIWPPLKANGTLKASGSAKKSDLGTIKISGGIKQVTYKGHPLYTFKSDTRAGETSGQGVAGFFVVSPSGSMITKKAVKKSAPTAPTAPTSPTSGW